MTFWTTVALCYLALLGIGLVLGRYLGSRFPGKGGGRGIGDALPPTPGGPEFGLEWPPLGSDFDRAFLPAAFTGEPVAQPA
jgi:hypothetical protein